MSDIPKDLLYPPEHEYLKKTAEPGVYQVGVTDYAQGELGDVVFVELPAQGASFERMQPFVSWLKAQKQKGFLARFIHEPVRIEMMGGDEAVGLA